MAASEAEPPIWVWAVWLVAALIVATAALLRPKRKVVVVADEIAVGATPASPAVVVETPSVAATVLRSNRLQPVPLLAVTAIISFCASVVTQVIYVSTHQPADPTTAGKWSAADLAKLSLLSALMGWGVGLGLILYGKGVRAVGYGIRRVPSGLLAGAIGIFVALPVVFFSLQTTLWVLEKFHVEHPAKHELLKVMDEAPSRLIRVMAMVAAVVAAPLFEELLFRGCVQGGLKRATGSPWVAIGVTSVMFAAIHPPWTIPPIFVFSILLGIVYDRTGNLWATTTMHALFNAFAIFNSGMN